MHASNTVVLSVLTTVFTAAICFCTGGCGCQSDIVPQIVVEDQEAVVGQEVYIMAAVTPFEPSYDVVWSYDTALDVTQDGDMLVFIPDSGGMYEFKVTVTSCDGTIERVVSVQVNEVIQSAGSGEWSDESIWPQADQFPNSPEVNVRLNAGDEVVVDRDVTIGGLTCERDAALHVGDGDIDVSEDLSTAGGVRLGVGRRLRVANELHILKTGSVGPSDNGADGSEVKAGRLTIYGALDATAGVTIVVEESLAVGDEAEASSDNAASLTVSNDARVEIGGDVQLRRGRVQVTTVDPVVVGGSVHNSSVVPSAFEWNATLMFGDATSETAHEVEAAGENRGPKPSGLEENFAIARIDIQPGHELLVVDAFDNMPGDGCEALYVGELNVPAGATLRVDSNAIVYFESLDCAGDCPNETGGCGGIVQIGCLQEMELCEASPQALECSAFQFAMSSMTVGDDSFVHSTVLRVDDDCHPDILLASSSGSAIVLHGLANGEFDPQPSVELAFDDAVWGVAAVDLNRDGLPDIVTTEPYGEQITVHIAEGVGCYEDRSEYVVPGGDRPSDMAFCDLNGDDILDIVTGGQEEVYVFYSKGAGLYEQNPEILIANGKQPRNVICKDLDGDGREDIVAASQFGKEISVFYRSPVQGFEPGLSVEIASGHAMDVAVFDLDKDKLQDIISADSGRSLTICYGTDQGGFECVEAIGLDGRPEGLMAADLDNDGDEDLVVTLVDPDDFDGAVQIIRNDAGTLVSDAVLPVGNDSRYSSVGDVDLDGDLDIVTPAESGRITILYNDCMD